MLCTVNVTILPANLQQLCPCVSFDHIWAKWVKSSNVDLRAHHGTPTSNEFWFGVEWVKRPPLIYTIRHENSFHVIYSYTMFCFCLYVSMFKRCSQSHIHSQPSSSSSALQRLKRRFGSVEAVGQSEFFCHTGFRSSLNMCSHSKFHQRKERGPRLPVFPSPRTSQCDTSQAAGRHNECGCDSAFNRPVTGDYPSVV